MRTLSCWPRMRQTLIKRLIYKTKTNWTGEGVTPTSSEDQSMTTNGAHRLGGVVTSGERENQHKLVTCGSPDCSGDQRQNRWCWKLLLTTADQDWWPRCCLDKCFYSRCWEVTWKWRNRGLNAAQRPGFTFVIVNIIIVIITISSRIVVIVINNV